jgi:hypothetical protein
MVEQSDNERVSEIRERIARLERELSEANVEIQLLAGEMYAKYGEGGVYETSGGQVIIMATKRGRDGRQGRMFSPRVRKKGSGIRTTKAEKAPVRYVPPPVPMSGNVIEATATLVGRAEQGGPTPYCTTCGRPQYTSLYGLRCTEGHYALEPMYEVAIPSTPGVRYCSVCLGIQSEIRDGIWICVNNHTGVEAYVGKPMNVPTPPQEGVRPQDWSEKLENLVGGVKDGHLHLPIARERKLLTIKEPRPDSDLDEFFNEFSEQI